MSLLLAMAYGGMAGGWLYWLIAGSPHQPVVLAIGIGVVVVLAIASAVAFAVEATKE